MSSSFNASSLQLSNSLMSISMHRHTHANHEMWTYIQNLSCLNIHILLLSSTSVHWNNTYTHTHTVITRRTGKWNNFLKFPIHSKVYFLFFFPLSCPALWQHNCNLNTLYAKQICFAKGSFINIKLPLMPINCPFNYFCLQYITCNRAEPDRGTRKEEK